MTEDFDNHRRIIDACPELVEGAAIIFKAPPQLGHCSTSTSKTCLSSRAPADARRSALPVSVLAWGLGGRRCRSGAANRFLAASHDGRIEDAIERLREQLDPQTLVDRVLIDLGEPPSVSASG